MTSNSPRLLVTLDIDEETKETIVADTNAVDVRFAVDPTDEDLAWATVILGNVPAPSLLRVKEPPVWLHSPNVGLDSYEEVRRRFPRLRISHTLGILDAAVAEHAVALLLALTRDLPRILQAQADRIWGQPAYLAEARPTTLAGKSAHVLGYGSIARAVIARLHGMGMRVTVYRRKADGVDQIVERFERLDRLSETISGADVVVSVLPSHAGTFHRIGRRELAAIRRGAYLVNVGRGSTIDEGALIAAIQDGGLAGVALDVFENEPLSPASPLWGLPGVIVSPHVAGRFDLEMRRQVAGFLVEYREEFGSA